MGRVSVVCYSLAQLYVVQVVFSDKLYFKRSRLNQYSLNQRVLTVKDSQAYVLQGSAQR